jgi:hypothetical protein
MLADHAQVADGKLFINGGGWTVTGPDPVPYGIGMLIDVPWDQTNAKHRAVLELLTSDGDPVLIPADTGEEPLRAEMEFEVGRPPGIKPGTPLTVPFALNFAPAPPIPPGNQFVWALSIDGQSDEDWRLTFATRPPAGPHSVAA